MEREAERQSAEREKDRAIELEINDDGKGEVGDGARVQNEAVRDE